MTDFSNNTAQPNQFEQAPKAHKFAAPEFWDRQIWTENPIFTELASLFPLAQCDDFPTVNLLEQWRMQCRPQGPVSFVENAELMADGRYYEEFIFHRQQVPTRYPNWHDLFGALIWCLFPKTKQLLNQLHIEQIECHGNTSRTTLRNKLTLLDECGVLVLYSPKAAFMIELLRNHQWADAFVKYRDCWQGQSDAPQLGAMMFGHANYEMATRPFIGCTGKMLALVVPADFFGQSLRQRIEFIDTTLSEQIANQGILVDPKQLSPLPLLGVPGWFEANKQPDFYQNTAYFRAKRAVKVQE